MRLRETSHGCEVLVAKLHEFGVAALEWQVGDTSPTLTPDLADDGGHLACKQNGLTC